MKSLPINYLEEQAENIETVGEVVMADNPVDLEAFRTLLRQKEIRWFEVKELGLTVFYYINGP